MDSNSGLPNLPALAMLRAALRKSRNSAARIALLTGLGCGLGLAIRISYPHPLWEPATLALAAGLLAAAGTAVMAKLRHDATLEDFVALLSKHPERLVWIYYLKIQIQPFGVHVRQICTLYFWLDDHKHLSLRAEEKDCQAIMNALRTSLDHCCFGYSLKKEQLYRADPALLRL